VEERKQPEVMKVLQMAAVAAKKVKKKGYQNCSTEADYFSFFLATRRGR
jgi:hypothetical protein